MKVAFFDFDGTLTKHDSFIAFAKFSVGIAAFLKAFLRTIPWLALWKIGIKTNSEAKEHLFYNLYNGMDYECFKERCNEFNKYIESDLREPVIEELSKHKENGHTTVIVSASIVDWIKPWAQTHNVDSVIGTEPEINDEGRLTGKFKTPNCHGKEKVRRILELIPDLTQYESWAYGDSDGDTSMLDIVTHPNRV